MVEMIRSRKASNQREERFDLFSNLLDANEEEDLVDGAAKLKDSELMGCFLSSQALHGVFTVVNRKHLYFPTGWSRGNINSPWLWR